MQWAIFRPRMNGKRAALEAAAIGGPTDDVIAEIRALYEILPKHPVIAQIAVNPCDMDYFKLLFYADWSGTPYSAQPTWMGAPISPGVPIVSDGDVPTGQVRIRDSAGKDQFVHLPPRIQHWLRAEDLARVLTPLRRIDPNWPSSSY